jgi:cytochrome c oxidase cbb3-type subunit 4
METYSFLREFADSWMLLFLFCFFIGVIFWAMRPGSSEHYKKTAESLFEYEDRPAEKGNSNG